MTWIREGRGQGLTAASRHEGPMASAAEDRVVRGRRAETQETQKQIPVLPTRWPREFHEAQGPLPTMTL